MIKKLISPLLLLLAAAIWGFAFAAQDAASVLPAFTLGALRSVLAAAFLLLVIPLTDKISKNGRRLLTKRGLDFTRRELLAGVILGAILTLATSLQQTGINMGTDGGKAGFITALYVTLVPVYAIFFGKRAKINIWVGVAISVLGFRLLCIKDGFTIVPSDIFVILCALTFPLHILVIDRFSDECDGVRMSQIQFLVSAILNSVLALIFDRGVTTEAVLSCALPIIFLGICSSGIAYTLQILGQRGTDPSAASVILSLESVFAVVGTAIFFGSTLEIREYIGCAIILAAVIISEFDFSILKRKKNENKKGEIHE